MVLWRLKVGSMRAQRGLTRSGIMLGKNVPGLSKTD